MRTKSTLMLASFATVVLLETTAVAGDRGRGSGREAKLERRMDRLEKRTRRLTRSVRHYRARALAAENALATRTVERDTLSQQVATTTSERDAAQNQLAAIPTAFERAVSQIRGEVEYADLVIRNQGGTSVPRGQLIAHAAMQYVVGHVSAPAYGYRNVFGGELPQFTAASVLETQAGICGHAALTFAAIVKRFRLPVRSVQFWYPNGDGHIAAEVYYEGGWHYFDPTFGAYYRDGNEILSIEAARTRPDGRSLLEYDTTQFWYRTASIAGVEYLSAETEPSTRVEIDKQPFVD
jgi:hypothetical protein